ncbi:MAG: tetratricopeptide repeat protein [Deltaproteobacteria bacterium]|nr:tetratricopeptide repeat protein [Deltaproteobacteria bacterium]NIS77503.1 tetratricopeptide repeat protein [Deltaproteobacteria bacterium]
MCKTAVGIVCGFFLAACISGCQTGKVREKTEDTVTLRAAESLIEEEDYRDAIEVLKNMINDHPSSPLLEKAYFDIGKAYHLDEQNVEAEVALDDFMRLYPDSELIPEALFLKGKNTERDKEKPGRDQSFTESAIGTYSQIVTKYPESASAKEARERISALKDTLAKHELLVARFYFKTKKFLSAEKRLKMAFEKYADTGTAPEIVSLLAETYLAEEKRDEALKLLEFMERNYPESDETDNIREEIKGAGR